MTWFIYLPVIVGVLLALSMIAGNVLRKARETETLPGCFGSDPGPQQQAENSCGDCPFEHICLPEPTSEGPNDDSQP